jgi:hypothetical protein
MVEVERQVDKSLAPSMGTGLEVDVQYLERWNGIVAKSVQFQFVECDWARF